VFFAAFPTHSDTAAAVAFVDARDVRVARR
jgi:hypothetical protein